MIKIRNIRKTFGENTILRGIDLDVGKGQVVVILGPSGSGKTTFLRCLNALEMPEDGQIEFDNERPLKIDFLKNRRSMTSWHYAANPAWCSNNTTSFRTKLRWKTLWKARLPYKANLLPKRAKKP